MSKSSFRIIHFSDLHAGFFSLQHGGFLDKRLFGCLNHLLRRRRQFRAERLQSAAKVFAALKADFFVCTGDLTSVGDPQEFALAEKLLAPILELAGDRFLYIPGNHDAYTNYPACRKALEDCFYRLNNKRFELHDLPQSQTFGPAEFILCNAAYPSPFFSSNGEIPEPDWKQLQKLLDAPRCTPFRLLLEHFPTRDAMGFPLTWRRKLKQAELLQQYHREKRFDVLLCGHIHHPFCLTAPHPQIQCAGSLTLNASFGLLDINTQNDTCDVSCQYLPQ